MQASPELTRLAAAKPPLPVSMVGMLVDAAVVILAYFAVLAAWGRPPRHEDPLLVLAATLLSLPGTLPFRRFSTGVLVQVVTRWGLLLLLLLGGGVIAEHRNHPPVYNHERFFLLAWWLAALTAVLFTHAVSPTVVRMTQRLQKRRKVVIVGVNEVAVRLGQAISSGEAQGQQLAGYFDDRSTDRIPLAEQRQRLGGLSDVGDFVRRQRVGCVYIALPVSSAPRMLDLLRQMQDSTASVYFVPNIAVADVIQCRVALVGGVPMVAVCETPLNGGYGVLKRASDVVLTAAALPLLLPLMAVIAVLIRATSKGPAIFKQRRFGLDGEEIVVWKFRTMTAVEDGSQTYRQATRDDDRITPIGRFLRRTSLDELPQFLNVLTGSMSIVGPRPHALAVNEQCRKLIPGYMLRHKVKPGITGWAQVNGFRGGDDLDALRKRTECDIQYLKSWSLGLDLLIIWKTALLVFGGDKNAF